MHATANRSLLPFWERALLADPTLRIRAGMQAQLAAKRVDTVSFSRTRLFSRMLAGEAALYTRFPISFPCADTRRRPDAAAILDEIRCGFPASKRARVRQEQSIVYWPVPKVVDKWTGRKSGFGVPDLHYANTRFDRRVNTSALNDFNLLQRGVHPFQSQDSLVLSSNGTFTDSHSDDHSGSNHCFVGHKLWLMWDTQEGFAHGLEDVERSDVTGRAGFDMAEFLRMKSSRWLVIGPGQTMFIPANLTHKVITLEHYLGAGQFSRRISRPRRFIAALGSTAPAVGARLDAGGRVFCRASGGARRAKITRIGKGRRHRTRSLGSAVASEAPDALPRRP